MLSCSIWLSAPSFWMGGDLAVHGTIRTVHTTYAACRKPYAAENRMLQKTICCNSTSNAPDDGRMYAKYVELRTH